MAALAGCLPPLTNPKCSIDEECLAVGDGWCHCIDGLCFKFDCPEPPPCPDDLVERHTDPECASLSATDVLGAAALAPARSDEGRIAVVHADVGGMAKVSLFTADLEPDGSPVELSVPLDETRAPVVLGDGRFAVATSGGVRAVAGAEADLLTSAVAASAPVPMAEGALLLVTTAGDLVRISSGISEPLAATVPPDAAAEIAVGSAEETAVVVAGGTLSVIDLDTGGEVVTEAAGFTGAPALAAGRVLAVTADGQLGGLLLGGAQPTPLSAVTVGAQPFSPVVDHRDVIYVASGASKHVHAIRYEGQAPVAGWTGGATASTALPDVPVSAALVGGGGRVYVPLLNGAGHVSDTTRARPPTAACNPLQLVTSRRRPCAQGWTRPTPCDTPRPHAAARTASSGRRRPPGSARDVHGVRVVEHLEGRPRVVVRHDSVAFLSEDGSDIEAQGSDGSERSPLAVLEGRALADHLVRRLCDGTPRLRVDLEPEGPLAVKPVHGARVLADEGVEHLVHDCEQRRAPLTGDLAIGVTDRAQDPLGWRSPAERPHRRWPLPLGLRLYEEIAAIR